MRFRPALCIFALLFLESYLLVGNALAQVNNVYIAQTAAGAANGADCNDAYAYTYFNTSGNWTSGTPTGTKIGPGTTVHLCGTFTETAGATLLTFQGSGTSGSPVSVVCEVGSALNAPYWGNNPGAIGQGAINASGKSYIVINGQNNCAISATANGTNLTYQANSAGVYVSGGSNVTIENLTIANMYVHVSFSSTSGGNASQVSAGIQMDKTNNFTASGNTIHDAVNGIFMGYGPSTSGWTVSGNTIYNCNWGVGSGDDSSGSSLSGVLVYANTIHDASNWDDSNDDYHHNGIYFWAEQGNSNVASPTIYNNYIYGNFSQCSPNSCATGGITMLSGSNDTFSSPYVFNNVLASTVANSYFGNGFIVSVGLIANNTIIGFNGSYGVAIDTAASSLYNNTVGSTNYWYIVGGTTLTASNYNDLYYPNNCFNYLGSTLSSLSAWQSTTAFDMNSITSAPNLSSSYVPNSGSPLIGAGTNLYSTCNGQPNPGLGALCFDAAGNPRPPTGAWTIGAYNASVVAPPTGLSAIAQ